MIQKRLRTPASVAILAMADIKTAVEGFNTGKANVFDALDAIVVAMEAYQAAGLLRRKAA